MSLFYGRKDERAAHAGRGTSGGRFSDAMDKELADAAARPLCIRHETRAAERPAMVRAALWRGLVARWSLAKCLACRGFPDAAPNADDAELDAALADAADVIESRAARGTPDAEAALLRFRAAILGKDGTR